MRLVLVTALLTLALASTAVADESGGRYTVRMCPTAGTPTDIARGGWLFSVFPTDAPLRSALVTCGSDGVFGLDLSHATAAPAAGAVWSFSVPLGVVIDRVRLERRVRVSQGYWYALQTEGDGIREFTGRTGASDPPPPTEWAPATFNVNGGDWVNVMLACIETSPCTPVESQTVSVRAFEADLVDQSAPTVKYAVTADPAPPAKPSAFTLTAEASDTGSGVKSVTAFVDGVIVGQATGDGTCAATPYTLPRPCPLFSRLTVPLAREAMERGMGKLEVEVVDAGGNRTRTPAVALSSFGYMTSTPTPEPTARGVLAFAFKGTTKTRVSSRWDAPPTVTGTVRGLDGAAMPGVHVRLEARTFLRDAAFAPLATATTDKHGAFSVRLPRGPSREIQATALIGDTASVALLRTSVPAPVRLRANRKSTSNRHSITFTGTVPGTPKGARPRIDLQALGGGGRWLTFTSPTLKNGKFHGSYRFTRTFTASTYRFRALLRTDPAFPFAAGKSREVRIHVRP